MFRIGVDAHDDTVSAEVIVVGQIRTAGQADAYRDGKDAPAGSDSEGVSDKPSRGTGMDSRPPQGTGGADRGNRCPI